MSNIVEQYLKKRKFSYKDNPTPHYCKNYPLYENLNTTLIIVFSDYTIKVAKYLTYDDIYYCLEILSEQSHTCKNVTEVFELVKNYDQPLSQEAINGKLKAYKILSETKLYGLQKENRELLNKVTQAQRSRSMFDTKSLEHKKLNQKINESQFTMTRNQKEIETLKKVVKVLNEYLA